MGEDPLQNIFGFHPGNPERNARHERLRAAGLELAMLIEELCPESDERTAAVKHVDYAVMDGNAAIARHS